MHGPRETMTDNIMYMPNGQGCIQEFFLGGGGGGTQGLGGSGGIPTQEILFLDSLRLLLVHSQGLCSE